MSDTIRKKDADALGQAMQELVASGGGDKGAVVHYVAALRELWQDNLLAAVSNKSSWHSPLTRFGLDKDEFNDLVGQYQIDRDSLANALKNAGGVVGRLSPDQLDGQLNPARVANDLGGQSMLVGDLARKGRLSTSPPPPVPLPGDSLMTKVEHLLEEVAGLLKGLSVSSGGANGQDTNPGHSPSPSLTPRTAARDGGAGRTDRFS